VAAAVERIHQHQLQAVVVVAVAELGQVWLLVVAELLGHQDKVMMAVVQLGPLMFLHMQVTVAAAQVLLVFLVIPAQAALVLILHLFLHL
jgi:hypothetical protein